MNHCTASDNFIIDWNRMGERLLYREMKLTFYINLLTLFSSFGADKRTINDRNGSIACELIDKNKAHKIYAKQKRTHNDFAESFWIYISNFHFAQRARPHVVRIDNFSHTKRKNDVNFWIMQIGQMQASSNFYKWKSSRRHYFSFNSLHRKAKQSRVIVCWCIDWSATIQPIIIVVALFNRLGPFRVDATK